MFKDFSLQAATMGLLASFVGFTSSFIIVLQGLKAVGASDAEAASGLIAASIAMGIGGILLSCYYKKPISVAWSTPGAALMVTAGAVEGGFAAAVGAFIICNIMIVIAGLWKPLGKAVASIPSSIANAMLAGVLLSLCIAPIKAIAFDPLLSLPIILAWAIAGRLNKLFAVPAALGVFVIVVAFAVDLPEDSLDRITESIGIPLVFISPAFNLPAMISIALPLFLVTMASQNIPGATVLKSCGYDVKPGPLFSFTGFVSVIWSFFGNHGSNLAAITAAMCAGEEAHENPDKRYWAAIISGIVYILFGLFAGVITVAISLAPTILIQAVAGLALVGAFSSSIIAAFKDGADREAAAITFLFTASGLSIFGISGAFWGLIAGGLFHILCLKLSR